MACLWLSACGGGGGGGGGTGTPNVVPTPANTSFRPDESGDTFAYTGTLSETFVRPPITTAPTPNPNPTSSQTLSANVTTNVVVSTGVSFNGQNNLSDFKATETDAYTSPPQSVTSITDQYLNFVPSGASTQVIEVGSNVDNTTTGVTIKTIFGTGNGLLDVIPEVAGAITPANNATLTTDETDPDGQTTSQSFHADGSYTETTNYPGGFTATVTENSDGTGQYSLPLDEFPNSTVAYGSVSGGNIPITITFAPGLAGPGPNPVVNNLSVPDWYPATPPVLYAQTYVNSGSTAIPSGCGVPAALSTRLTNKLVQTTTTVDTIFGESETQTVTSYDSQGLGIVCLQLNDTTLQYYDFTGQSQYTLDFSDTPVQTTTLAETLGLQAATVIGTSGGLRASATAPVVQALRARFEAAVVHQRTLRHAAALRKLQRAVTVQAPSMRISH